MSGLNLAQNTALTDRELTEQNLEPALAELSQLRSLTHEQVERIRQLEQALDQSLESLKELRLRILDQEFLEAQLAATEEISNIQQQAIGRLKGQLAEQKQTLPQPQLAQTLQIMESLALAQQAELGRLRTQSHDRAQVKPHQAHAPQKQAGLQASFYSQQRLSDLEADCLSAQVLVALLDTWVRQAQAQVSALIQELGDRPEAVAVCDRLSNSLEQMQSALQQPSRAKLRQQPSSSPDLAVVQSKVVALETQISKHLTTQAMLQHAGQELETERDRQQSRIASLEAQAAEMQEQILRQAQHATEQETAIQHWKDRHLSHCAQVETLAELLQTVPHLPAAVAEILAGLQIPTQPPANPSLSLVVVDDRPGSQLDLPEFLMRRRSYTPRRSSIAD